MITPEHTDFDELKKSLAQNKVFQRYVEAVVDDLKDITKLDGLPDIQEKARGIVYAVQQIKQYFVEAIKPAEPGKGSEGKDENFR